MTPPPPPSAIVFEASAFFVVWVNLPWERGNLRKLGSRQHRFFSLMKKQNKTKQKQSQSFM
jgi:hypothetical protein